MRRWDFCEVKHLAMNCSVDIVWQVRIGMWCELRWTEEVLCWADDKLKNCYDENHTSTDEPNDEIEHELLLPCSMNVLMLHSTEPLEESSIHKVRTQSSGTQCLTHQCLLDNLGHLIFHDLTCQSLFSNQSFLHRRFGTCSSKACGTQNHSWSWSLPHWMPVDSGCQNRLNRMIYRNLQVGMERCWPRVGCVPGKALGCRDLPILGESYRGAYGLPIEWTSMLAPPLRCRGGFVSALPHQVHKYGPWGSGKQLETGRIEW